MRRKIKDLKSHQPQTRTDLAEVPEADLEAMSEALAIIFNKSLQSGNISDDWRSANVTSIFKREAKLSREIIDQSA